MYYTFNLLHIISSMGKAAANTRKQYQGFFCSRKRDEGEFYYRYKCTKYQECRFTLDSLCSERFFS